ncbi:MAG: FMN-binding glutamate synthase family protein [Patescibacteria group bacterium]
MFWSALAGSLAALGIAGVFSCILFRPALNLLLDALSRRIFMDPYHENLLEMANVILKVGPLDLAELELRSESGKPEKRPFGARRRISLWQQFFFNPVYLAGQPLPAETRVETQVVIGPRAAKPLTLEIPILAGGMAWGMALSSRAKIALARGTALAGTATNTGAGPYLPAERETAKFLVIQLSKGYWKREPEIVRQADMVEIVLGHGAVGSVSTAIEQVELDIDPEFQAALAGARPLVNSILPEGPGPGPLQDLVAEARSITGGVPVGVKIGATDRLEAELAAILQAEPDFITIDGCEGGTHGVGTALHDDTGLPTIHALCRAERYLRQRGLRERLSLLVGGGLYQPGAFLKAMALGADAVLIGTAALLSLAHGQVEKVTPFEPPTQLLFHRGNKAGNFDPEKGARYLARYLQSCVSEMGQVARTLGRPSLGEVCRADLCCLDRDLAVLAGVRWAGAPPAPEDG